MTGGPISTAGSLSSPSPLHSLVLSLSWEGTLAFKRFREIETDARNSTVVAAEHAQDAKRVVKEIEKTRDKADEIVRGMTAETAAGNPEEAKQAVLSVRENPRASLVDEAIANAISLQQQGKRDDAIKRWQAVAHIAERSDDALAATAWFSVGYLNPGRKPGRRPRRLCRGNPPEAGLRRSLQQPGNLEG